MPTNPLADAIRAAFKRSGLSMKRLSDDTGVPYASIHGLITGQRDISIGTAAQLCKALGLRLVEDSKRK